MNLFLCQTCFKPDFTHTLCQVSLGSWVALIPSAKGDLSPSGQKFFTCSGLFYPWANVQDQTFVWCSPWANSPSDSFPQLLLALVPSQGHPALRKALAGPWAALEPERAHRAAIHCLLSQLSGTIWADNFIFISLKVCCRWECPATGDISGDSLENIRKAVNSLLGIISVAQIKSRVLILSTHLWGPVTSIKNWINLLLEKKKP